MVVVSGSDQADAPNFNYGHYTVHLYAPGLNIRVLDNSNGLGGNFTGGTSFAAPMVAGAAALCFQAGIVTTAPDMVERLVSTARPVTAMNSLCVSGGVLDIHALLGLPCY